MHGWLIYPKDLDAISLSDSDPLLFEKQVAYEGQFYKHSEDMEFEINEKWMDHWI